MACTPLNVQLIAPGVFTSESFFSNTQLTGTILMVERKSLLKIFENLGLFCFCWCAPRVWERPLRLKNPLRKGMDGQERNGMGNKIFPCQPVRGGIANYASPLYIGLMNPNHYPVNDWVTIRGFL